MFSKKYKIDSFSGSLRLNKGMMATVNPLITILIALMSLEPEHFISFMFTLSPMFTLPRTTLNKTTENIGNIGPNNSIQSVRCHHAKPHDDT